MTDTTSTYVITGGAGFIGAHLAERLLREGQRVRVIDNLLTGSRETLDGLAALNGDYTFHAMDINDTEALQSALDGADYVFHCAGLPSVPRSIAEPHINHQNTLVGTLSTLVAAKDAGVRRFVYTGSGAIYGDLVGERQYEDMAPAPRSPYAVSKLAGERYSHAFTRTYGLETVALRCFNVYGPRQSTQPPHAAVIPAFITRMLAGEAPVIYGDGEQTRDFVYIDDVVEAGVCAMHAPQAANEVINVGSGERVSLLQLVERLNGILGTALEPVHEAERAGEARHAVADLSVAKTLLDYTPATDLDTGLERTVAHYRG